MNLRQSTSGIVETNLSMMNWMMTNQFNTFMNWDTNENEKSKGSV